ncbi:hypothetical protein QUB72_00915 [Enterococcus faecium]|nr:hypothetical protein [Enterococcus faecium]
MYRKRAVTWPFIFTQLYGLYQILVLHEGHLVEKGTHDELRFADGIYQKLWEI